MPVSTGIAASRCHDPLIGASFVLGVETAPEVAHCRHLRIGQDKTELRQRQSEIAESAPSECLVIDCPPEHSAHSAIVIPQAIHARLPHLKSRIVIKNIHHEAFAGRQTKHYALSRAVISSSSSGRTAANSHCTCKTKPGAVSKASSPSVKIVSV